MTRITFTLAALLIVCTVQAPSATAQLAAQFVSGDDIAVPNYIANAIASSKRPATDKERDGGRQPGKVMAFFGIKPGDKVAELITAGGYYSAVLSGIVGDRGKVYGHANEGFMSRQEDGSPLLKRIATDRLINVEEVIFELEDDGLPEGEMDAVFVVLIYHDMAGAFNTDRVRMNRAIYDALKPGGVYGIIDHHAAPGMGVLDTTKNHRIERHVVAEDIISAGFELAADTDLLENLDDPLDIGVFSPQVRGSTHRMVLKFKKPLDG
jgi:predicted methyltransferase